MPGPGGQLGPQVRALAMRVLPAMHQQMAQGHQPDTARAIEQDPLAQHIASAQGREHFNQSPGVREIEHAHPLGGAPNLQATRAGLERAGVGEAQDHAIGIGRASTPGLGGGRPATDDPLQAARALAASPSNIHQMPTVRSAQAQEQARPQSAGDLQAQVQAAIGAQNRSPGTQAREAAVGRAQLEKAAIERAPAPQLGAQLSSRVDSGAITRGQAQDTAAERDTFKRAYGSNWRSVVYGEDLKALRSGAASSPKYKAANKALMQRRALMLEHAKAINSGKSSGGTTAP